MQYLIIKNILPYAIITIKSYITDIVLLPISMLTGYRLRYITHHISHNKLMHDVKYCSRYSDSMCCGILISRYFIGYANPRDCYNSIHVFCHDKYYKQIITTVDTKIMPKSEWQSYKMSTPVFKTGKIHLTTRIRTWKYELREWQSEVLKLVTDKMDDCPITVLLSGTSGAGKSSIAEIIASKFGTELIIGYTGIDKIDLSSIYCAVDPENDYYVVLLDECDCSTNYENKSSLYDINLGSKQKWNMLLDKINKGIYGNIIFIATTNMPIAEFPDQSLVADHRWMIKYESSQ